MKVCLIIPTLNEEKFIGNLIDSINLNSHKEKEIIVVDDNSNDKTVEIARKKGAKVLINSLPRRGPAHGWNKAARKTDADIIFILGAETIFEDKKLLEKSLKPFNNPKVVAAKIKFHTKPCTLVERIVTSEWGISFEPRLLRRDFFLSIGGFPEIGYGEDQIFAKKVEDTRRKGFETAVIIETYFLGHGVHTLSEMFSQAKWYGKSAFHFLKYFKGFEKIKMIHSVYLRLFYLFSFLLGFLGFYNNLFFVLWVYFFLVSTIITFNSFKEKNLYRILRIFTFLFFGFGMFYGVMLYLTGIEKETGK